MPPGTGDLAREWWCRGGGAAVATLLAVVACFRGPSDPVLWAAVSFLVAHTALAVRRWSRGRRSRTTATVTRHHGPRPEPFLPALPVTPIRTMTGSLRQTKNTL